MKKLLSVLVLALLGCAALRAQAQVKLQLEIGTEVYAMGSTVAFSDSMWLNGTPVQIRVFALDSNSTEFYCAKAIDVWSYRNVQPFKLVTIPVPQNLSPELPCVFNLGIVRSDQGGEIGFLVQGVYRLVNGKRVSVKIPEKERFVKLNVKK